MRFIQSIPVSLMVILGAILCVPAISYGSFHYIFPSTPDAVYTKHGKLKVEWSKFSENESFTEYLGKEKYFNEDSLTADILILRSYQNPQISIYENSKVAYSSVVMHQSINCKNRTVSVQDLLMFSKGLSKGAIVKDLYDLDWDLGPARAGTIDESKVAVFCGFEA